MKKNYFYHPLVKGLCLVLCFASILTFAFCGLRFLILEETGMMLENPAFYMPQYGDSLKYSNTWDLYVPEPWCWEAFVEAEGQHWYGSDILSDRIDTQLQQEDFAAYLTYTGDASEAPAFPEIVIENGAVYPAECAYGLRDFLNKYHSEHSNLRVRVLLDENVIFSNDAAWDDVIEYGGTHVGKIGNQTYGDLGHTITLEYGFLQDMPVEDDYQTFYHAWMEDVVRWEKWMIAAAGFGVLAFGMVLCVLWQTGMCYDTGAVRLNVIDKLPAEIVLFVKGTLTVFVFAGVFAGLEWYLVETALLMFGYLQGNLRVWLIPMCIIALTVVGIYLCLSILRGMVRRIRAGKWWQNTIVFRVLSPVGRGLRWMWNMGCTVFGNLPLAAKWLAGCAIFGLWTLIVIFENGLVVLWFFTALTAGLFLCIYMLEFDAIRRAAKKIAAGDINAHTDTSRLHGAPKQIGDSLNHIGDAISVAVEDRMKSERFRTELITNVSHDLKTPLTSIINYTDLLSKEEIGNETAKEYVDVLSRQAVRLKKLTEDLLEASKASTGAISVSMQPTDAAELLTQAVGEYEERFAARSLHAVLDIRHNPLWISADGKHLWRVFDNLLGNICKYSMSGTRVYLTAEAIGKTVVMTFRNITENPISVTAEELTERFVRGDASRHTEGSGLGLAIADSLCKLQGGTLSLTVDGDLFKAVVTFAAVSAPKDAE